MFYFRYYQFDSVVVREILGRKLSSRNRKDMDDVSEKTRIPIRSCRRQVCTGKTLSCHDVPGKLSLVTMYLQNFLQSGYTSKTFSSQDVRQNILLSGCPAITFSCTVTMYLQSILQLGCPSKVFSCQDVPAKRFLVKVYWPNILVHVISLGEKILCLPLHHKKGI